MTKQKKVELFENKEKETQLRERFEKDWYNWEEVKEKLEKIRQKEEIDKNLSKLEWSVEENYKYIKSLLEKYKDELDLQESLKDKAKTSLDEKIEEEKDKLKEKLLQKTKDIPIIWWLLYKALKWIDKSKEEKKDDWFWEKTKKWFFWWLWWTILTIFWWFIAYDKYKEEVENVAWKLWESIAEWVDKVKTVVSSSDEKQQEFWEKAKIDTSENQAEWDETKEKVKEEFNKLMYPAWFRFIISLSWEKLISEISPTEIWKWLENISYKEFLDKWKNKDFKDKVLWKEKDNEQLKKQYDKVFLALSSKNTKDLFRIWLKAETVEKILLWKNKNKENIKIKNEIWEEKFWKILKSIDNNTFDYKDLSIKELSILYLHTIPVFTSWAISWMADELNLFAHEIIWWWSELKELLDNQKEDFFSKNLIWKIVPKKTEIKLKNLDELIIYLDIIDEKDKQDLEKLFNFKNEIFSDKFLANKKLLLDDETKKILERKLDYKYIIALYAIMWWDSNLDNLSPVNIPILLALIYNIIKSWNTLSDSMLASNYIKKYVQKSLLPETWKEIFSEDEKIVMRIYGKNLLDIFISSYLGKFYSWTGLLTNKESLGKTAIATWTSWLALRYIWVKWTKRAIKAWNLPFLSKYVKRLWWLWIVSWVAFGGLSMIWDDGLNEKNIEKFDRELSEAYEDWDVEKIVELIENHEKWVKEYDYFWKKIFLVSYEWKDPYIIYDGKIYMISVFDDSNSFSWFIRWFVPFLERDMTYDWKSIKDIKIEWNNIIFWDNVIQIDFTKSLEEWLEELSLPNDVVANLSKLVKNVPWFKDGTFWWETTNILKLWSDGKGTVIWLVPIWEIELKTVEE